MGSQKYLLALGLGFAGLGCQQKTPESVFPEAGQKPSACTQESIPTQFIVKWKDGRVSLEHAENAEAFKQGFLSENIASVQHVEFNKTLRILDGGRTSSSEVFGSGPGADRGPAALSQAAGASVKNTELDTWGEVRIEAKAVWDAGVRGEGIIVSVVDSMVDVDHPQLFPQILTNDLEALGVPGSDDDGNGYVDDVRGWDFYGNAPRWSIGPENDHGTHVAGIVAAAADQGPMTGIAPAAKILPANFMDQEGSGSLLDAVAAINYSVSRGAKVINASWGGACSSKVLQETIEGLAAKNVLFVAASGNEGLDLDAVPTFPANLLAPSQLTVAAVFPTDNMTSWSNSSFRFVQIAAPGASILSTTPNASYKYLSGTSMAAPFVSGAAALIWSAKPSATALQVREALLRSVDVRDYRVSSKGRLNVRKAYEELLKIVH